MVVLIPIVIGRIATGDPPTPSEPPSEPVAQESDAESPPSEPPRPPIAPTVQPLPPPPPYVPPQTCADDVELYADVSLWYGITDLHADTGSGRSDAGSFRNAAGFVSRTCRNNTRGVDVRGGLVLDFGSPDLGGAALGGELAIDWPVSETWRVGFRTSLTRGSTTQYFIGARALAGPVSLGIDVVNSANHEYSSGYSNGSVSTEISTHAVLAGFGLTNKPGRYVMLAEAITTGIVLGLAITACASGGC